MPAFLDQTTRRFEVSSIYDKFNWARYVLRQRLAFMLKYRRVL